MGVSVTPDQISLLRRLALNEKDAIKQVMGGASADSGGLDGRSAALVRVAALLSVDSDPATFRWAVEEAIAAGVEDTDFVETLVAVAPIIGVARLTSSLPHLMAALDLEVVED
jgi:alkylhydroperoxidase/carboxymuconolactone decarboxylase family protein YurZ